MGPMIRKNPTRAAVAAVLVAIAASAAWASQSVLVVSDSLRDRFWTISTVDGSLIRNDFILNDAAARFSQVISCQPSGRGTLLMNDIDRDAIYEYSMTGIHLRTLADTSKGILDPWGMCVAYGKIFFTCADSNNTPGYNAIWSMDMDGSNCALWYASVDLGRVRDIKPVEGGFIVGDSLNNRINFVSLDRTVCRVWSTYGLGFPQQITKRPDGGYVVTAFNAPSFGLNFYDAQGNIEGATSTITSPRGVWPLDNGEFVYAGGDRIMAYNPVTNVHRTIITGSSPISGFRFIYRLEVPTPCPADLNIDGAVDGADMGLLLGAWGPGNGIADINRDGVVDGADMGLLLGAWGICPP
jgi:hypothetical protein